jgi:hypothetical protein
MPNRCILSTIVLLAVPIVSSPVLAQQAEQRPLGEVTVPRQPGAVYDRDLKGKESAPAPLHDISGIWNCATGSGIPCGGETMPSDGIPYTALGRQTFQSHKTTGGVAVAETNDPICWSGGRDPQGFPRILLHNFRSSVIMQTRENVVILYEFSRIWRTIWTDGRKLPENPKPTWWGYSVGKWTDDYTFVVETNGLSDQPWLDNAGRPQSTALHVTEEYKRTDRDHLMMTATLDDPKMYTKPWVVLKRFLVLQAPEFTIPENECSPSETTEYNDLVANPSDSASNTK